MEASNFQKKEISLLKLSQKSFNLEEAILPLLDQKIDIVLQEVVDKTKKKLRAKTKKMVTDYQNKVNAQLEELTTIVGSIKKATEKLEANKELTESKQTQEILKGLEKEYEMRALKISEAIDG